MIWTILLALLILGTTATWVWDIRRQSFEARKDYIAAVIPSIVLFFMLIASLIGMGINQNDVTKYKLNVELIQTKIEQRDALITIVEKQLSNDQYIQLMSAKPEADVTVILGNNASAFLIEKAKLLVSLNQELNGALNTWQLKRIELCAFARNSMTPRFFVNPECPERLTAEVVKK